MTWTAPRIWTVGEMVTAAIMNVHVRDNLTTLGTHAHSGAAGDGATALGNLTHVTFGDGTIRAAPGAGLTRIYVVSAIAGTAGVHYRAGSAGSDKMLVNTAHASSHEPGGTDAMAVDAAAATGSLRTLGTGAQQAAAGNHTH